MNPNLAAAINIAAFVLGQLLVTRRHWAGFLVWAASNLMVAVSCLMRESQATAFMFFVYFAVNIYSIVVWSRQAGSTRSKAKMIRRT